VLNYARNNFVTLNISIYYRYAKMDYQYASITIINLKNADLELRNRLIESGKLGKEYNEEMEQLHLNNA